MLTTMLTIKDSALLPEQYTKAEEPSYMGRGTHSVDQLENICEAYKELVHQLRVREVALLTLTGTILI